MPNSLFEKIIDEIARVAPATMVFMVFFGEPFLLRDLPERIDYGKRKGLEYIALNSNGVMMDREKSQAVVEVGLDEIHISIDATNPVTYEKIRGGDFEAAVNNTLAFKEVLDQYGTRDQKMYVQFVESDINASEREDFISFWNERDIPVMIRPRITWAGLVEKRKEQDVSMVQRTPCFWSMQTFVVCSNGEVAYCGSDVHNRGKFGSVMDDSIQSIWKGALAKYRQKQEEGKWEELPDFCRTCSDWNDADVEFFHP